MLLGDGKVWPKHAPDAFGTLSRVDDAWRAVVPTNHAPKAVLENETGGQFAPEEPYSITLLNRDPVEPTRIRPESVRRTFAEYSRCVPFPYFWLCTRRPPALGVGEMPRFDTEAVVDQGV
jgi:hypothetical protein